MGYGYQKYVSETSRCTIKSNKLNKCNLKAATNGERVLDISEWQGDLTEQQVKSLKENYDFIIIRAQYGSEKIDASLSHNSAILDKYNLDFGVYSLRHV